MYRLMITYLGIFAAVYLVLSFLSNRKTAGKSSEGEAASRGRLRAKPPKGMWVQVYDAAEMEDAKRVMARLEEEDLECILYEQGRKDVHGNALKGFGLAVPKSAVARAQNLISRMPV
jgi:hypothetical protein